MVSKPGFFSSVFVDKLWRQERCHKGMRDSVLKKMRKPVLGLQIGTERQREKDKYRTLTYIYGI